MPYKSELDYLMKVLGKMRVQTVRMQGSNQPLHSLDMGLRKVLGLEEDYARLFQQDYEWVQENTIYKLTDPFLCSYILLRLPGTPEHDVLLVGPYLTREKTREQLLEEAEQYAVVPHRFNQLQRCYSDIPVVSDEGWLFTMLNVLGETLWGRAGAFSIVEFRREEVVGDHVPQVETRDSEELMLHIKAMEKRYSYENQLIELVSQGLTHRAEMMVSHFSSHALEQRTTDEVRNTKNYVIVCNTLLRKAAESGGVHPVHLDRVSSEFAHQVESLICTEDGMHLMREMVRSYCRLVQKHSIRHYSPLVQKTVTYIESDLTSDLSLRTLAAKQNVSAGYFSTLFHKETGKTVTEYVTEARMEKAAHLLRTTHLQIQTVAQHCGMSDVNYFSKLFRRHYGVSPKQFREDNLPHPPKASLV